jgi:hypothetical protein
MGLTTHFFNPNLQGNTGYAQLSKLSRHRYSSWVDGMYEREERNDERIIPITLSSPLFICMFPT